MTNSIQFTTQIIHYLLILLQVISWLWLLLAGALRYLSVRLKGFRYGRVGLVIDPIRNKLNIGLFMGFISFRLLRCYSRIFLYFNFFISLALLLVLASTVLLDFNLCSIHHYFYSWKILMITSDKYFQLWVFFQYC